MTIHASVASSAAEQRRRGRLKTMTAVLARWFFVQLVHRGKKLVKGVRRASNKGAVGAAFRYHDTTIAFVTCHLAADKKGRSNLGGRLKDTRMVLEGMELEYDALGFDLQVEARDPHAGMYAYDALGFDLQVTRMQACMRLRSRVLTTRSALSLPAALLPPRRPPRRPRTGPPP